MALSFADFAEGKSAPQSSYSPNVKKFFDFIGEAEGSDYGTIVGGTKFSDYSKHPGVVGLTTPEGSSTAAGRYQITKSTYDTYAKKLGVSDFSPETQDKIAYKLIEDSGALPDVEKGDYESAVNKLGSIWASFPSSNYKQPKRSWEWTRSKLGTKQGFGDYAKGAFADSVKEEATPAGETNWAGTGPKMSFGEYMKSGFAGRFISGALKGDSALMKQADDAVIAQFGEDIKKSPTKYQEKFTEVYRHLKDEEAKQIEAEKKANPTPSFGQSLKEFGSELIKHPGQTAANLIYELGKDPELFFLGGAAAPKTLEAAAATGRAAKIAKTTAEVGKTAVKAGATGVGLETMAEIGDQRGLDLQQIINTGGTFATLGAGLHLVGKGGKAVYEAGKGKPKAPSLDEINDTLNMEEGKLTGEKQVAEPVQRDLFEAEMDQDLNANPSVKAAGDVFGTSEAAKTPIEAVKRTIRELKINERAAKLWRAALEKAVPDQGIRERMTMAIEADRPYDKLLTDAEKETTLTGLKKAIARLEAKTNFEDANAEAENAAKLKRIKYVVDRLEALPSEEHAMPILKEVQDKLAVIGEQAKTEGLLDQLRQNYITHALNFTESVLSKDQIRTLMDRLFKEPKDSRFVRDFTQHRIYRTIRELEDRIRQYGDEMGLDVTGVKVERDVAKIAEIYQKSMVKAVLERRLLNFLENQRTKGKFGNDVPLVTQNPDLAFREGYEFFKGRGSEALNGYAVHPDMVAPLKFLYRQTDPNLLMRAMGSVSMLSKFLNTIGSLFHATSLMVARTTSTPGAMIREIFTAGRGTRMALEALEKDGASEMVNLAMKNGLEVATEDVQKSIVTDLGNTVDKLFGEARVARRVTDPLESLFIQKMNRFTWDYMHAGGKMQLFQTWFTKIKTQHPEMSDEAIAREVASFVNNTLGGLDWLEVADQVKNKYGRSLAMWALNTTNRDLLQILLFAPDWTISTLRSFTTALPKELMKPKNWDLREGVRGFIDPKTQADLARRYVVNTALVWLTILNGFNMAFTGRPVWTNEDPTRVDLGDGTSMQMAKHSMEAAEWIRDPEKTLGNKLGFWPKAVITMTTGKAYPSPNAPMVKDNTALGRLAHVAKTALPFQISAGMNAPVGERAKRSFASFMGVPIYGQTNKQHTSPEVKMERKLQRKESRRENKEEKLKRKQ